MGYELSSENQQYLDELVADGIYESRQVALEAAVRALREQNDLIAEIPQEHLRAIDEALNDPRPSRPMTEKDWARIRKLAEGPPANP